MRLDADPGAVAIRSHEVKLTYRELKARIDDLALRLESSAGLCAVATRNEIGPASVILRGTVQTGKPVALLSPASSGTTSKRIEPSSVGLPR